MNFVSSSDTEERSRQSDSLSPTGGANPRDEEPEPELLADYNQVTKALDLMTETIREQYERVIREPRDEGRSLTIFLQLAGAREIQLMDFVRADYAVHYPCCSTGDRMHVDGDARYCERMTCGECTAPWPCLEFEKLANRMDRLLDRMKETHQKWVGVND